MNVLERIRKKNLKIKDNHPAIITSEEIISYTQLNNKIHSYAEYFYSQGIRQKNKIAILGNNNSEYLISVLALWELNTCVVPLNIRLTDTELSELINFSDADFLLINKNEKRNLSVKILQIVFPFSNKESKLNFEPFGINPDDISLIMFTSGVTGKPKGVMHSLNDLLNSADNSQSFLSQTSDDMWLASLPFYHIGGLSIITRAFRFGSSLIIPESLQTDDLKIAFDRFKPSFASLVSTQLKRLLDTKWKPGKELKSLLLGGGLIDKDLIKEALSAGCRISNVYGSTETSAFITANNLANIGSKPLSAGKVLGQNKIFIVDDKLNILPARSIGEIVVESDALFHGYYNDTEATKQKLKDEKFLTDDIGYIDEDGDLFVEARRTDLIISGGENVNPLEVENILDNLPQVKECCVFALEDKEWGQIVAAAVVLDSRLSIKELTALLKEKIAPYKIPKRFFPIEKIPRSSLGKILREKVIEEIKIMMEDNFRD